MSGINGLKETHDPSERLSDYLADPITKKRPNDAAAQSQHAGNLQPVPCTCRDRPRLSQAEKVVDLTNDAGEHGASHR